MKIKEKINLWKYDNFVITIGPDPDLFNDNHIRIK